MQFLLYSSFASLAVAGHVAPLFARQATTSASISCTNGGSVCGSSCFDPTSYLCCSSAGALCAIGSYCSTDSDGNMACCKNGENCQGSGTAVSSAAPVTYASSVASGATGSPSAASSSASASSTPVTCSSSQSKCGDGCYDPTAYTCCSESGALCQTGQYCTTNSLSEAVCCAVGFNCDGQGSSTASAQSATTVSSSATASKPSTASSASATTSGAATSSSSGSSSGTSSGTSSTAASTSGTKSASSSGSSTSSSTGSKSSTNTSSKSLSTSSATGNQASTSASSSSSSGGAASPTTGLGVYMAGAVLALGALA